MSLSPAAAVEIVKSRLWPMLEAERERVKRIDRWMRWDHDMPHQPRQSTKELKDLLSRAVAPWGQRVVTAATDMLDADGFRAEREAENAAPWQWWQANGLDARQMAIYDSAVGYGIAYTVVLPGESWLGEKMPVIRGLDPSQMIAVYEDPAWDDWPVYALRAEPVRVGDRMSWKLRLYDATDRHNLIMSSSGDSVEYVSAEAHDAGVTPVVRFTINLDLRGRANGDIEPVIPMLGCIDQTKADRLLVQRFASWKVRTIAGMAKPETQQDAEAEKLRLQIQDILVSTDPNTKFGVLDETALDGFITAHDADVRALAAVSQSPAHELIGQMANMSADALASAEASLTRRVERMKKPLGEAWEQTLRLSAKLMGDPSATDDSTQIHWRDMESRSLAQAADALGKLATMLNVPVELLWEKIPGFTQQDIDRAKDLVEQAGGMDALLRALLGNVEPAAPAAA